MSKAKGIREVAYVDIRQGGGIQHAHAGRRRLEPLAWHDCAGSGQIVVQNGVAYVGNMRNPQGTLTIDVSDPRHPKPLAEISMPVGTHSHKVRVAGDIMITNRESLAARAEGSCLLHARCATRLATRAEQRRDGRRSRTDLPA